MGAKVKRLPLTRAESRGEAIKRRMVALGMTPSSLSKAARIDRGTVTRAIADVATVRDTTYTQLEITLEGIEEEVGQHGPDLSAVAPFRQGDVVELQATIGDGADAVRFVVKGPIADREELEAMISRLVRGTR